MIKTLKVLKRRNDVKMNNKEYDQFLNRTANYLQTEILPEETDLIRGSTKRYCQKI